MYRWIKRLWIVCCLIGWALSVISLPFLPAQIPIHFGDGVPNGFAGPMSIFLWPISQLALCFFGSHKTLLPRDLGRLLSDTQYAGTVLGLLVFCLLLEVVIIAAALLA